MIDLSKHYPLLTATERLKLSIEAMARQDWQEVGTLGETCPTFKYNEQRDLAYTGKYLDLQSISLLHAVFYWRTYGAMIAAYSLIVFVPDDERQARYKLRRSELMAMIEAWRKFCDYAGFDHETVLQAFGLQLDHALDGLPNYDVVPDDVMIEQIYQQHVKNWG